MDNDSTPDAAEDLTVEDHVAVIIPPKPKAAPKPRKANAHKADKPKVDRSKRPHANVITPEYAKAHRVGVVNVARAAGVTPEQFLAMSKSKRHGIFDIREQRPMTAKVFALVSENEWPDTREVFCFAIGRIERTAELLRIAGSATK